MRGILFKPDMIQAIVEERKTVTRRKVNIDPLGWLKCEDAPYCFIHKNTDEHKIIKPRYHVSEVVYIKEAWATEKQYNNLAPHDIPQTAEILYMADGIGEWPINLPIGKLRSPMFLKEINARYFIQITDVRAERLQEITIQDVIAEGIPPETDSLNWVETTIDHYRQLWDSINPDYPFSSNPWVWRYEFKKVEV
jgi:hypothetical protein